MLWKAKLSNFVALPNEPIGLFFRLTPRLLGLPTFQVGVFDPIRYFCTFIKINSKSGIPIASKVEKNIHESVRKEIINYQGWLYGLAFLCATYAYYTLGFAKLTNISALWFGLIGNIVVILFAAFAVYKLLPINKFAALLIMPVIVWTIFASFIVIGEMKLEKLI